MTITFIKTFVLPLFVLLQRMMPESAVTSPLAPTTAVTSHRASPGALSSLSSPVLVCVQDECVSVSSG